MGAAITKLYEVHVIQKEKKSDADYDIYFFGNKGTIYFKTLLVLQSIQNKQIKSLSTILKELRLGKKIPALPVYSKRLDFF